MSKFYSSRHIIKVLQMKGFIYVSQKGSHVKFRKESVPILNVIIPAGHKEISPSTFKSILRQSGLTKKDFKDVR